MSAAVKRTAAARNLLRNVTRARRSMHYRDITVISEFCRRSRLIADANESYASHLNSEVIFAHQRGHSIIDETGCSARLAGRLLRQQHLSQSHHLLSLRWRSFSTAGACVMARLQRLRFFGETGVSAAYSSLTADGPVSPRPWGE
jgi:hypothetical protein